MTDVLEKLPKMHGEGNMWGSRKLNSTAAHSNQDESPTAARYNPLYTKTNSASFGLSFNFSLSVFPCSLLAVVKNVLDTIKNYVPMGVQVTLTAGCNSPRWASAD
jgi:hypothetical protein